MLLVTVKKKVEKTFWFCDCFIYFKDGDLQQLKGKQSSKLGMWNGYHDTKGVSFPSKMVCKRGWARERTLPVYIIFFLVSPGWKFNWTLIRYIWLWWQHTSNTTLLWFTTLSAYFASVFGSVNWIQHIYLVPVPGFLFRKIRNVELVPAKVMLKLMWRW